MKLITAQRYEIYKFSTLASMLIIYFYQYEQNLTQFVKVLLIKLSDMLHSLNFLRLFHRQSFTLYGTNIIIATVSYIHS